MGSFLGLQWFLILWTKLESLMTLRNGASRGPPGGGVSREDLEAENPHTRPYSDRTPPERCYCYGVQKWEDNLPRTVPKPVLLTMCLFWPVVSEVLRCWGCEACVGCVVHLQRTSPHARPAGVG